MKVMKKRILVVEDDQSLSDVYDMILTKNGYDVSIANDGKHALELTQKIEPDLILLDLRMPVMGGVQFLREYHLKDAHPHVKVIVFSNLDTQREIDEAFELGAHKYMLKAWASPKELVKLVADTLRLPN